MNSVFSSYKRTCKYTFRTGADSPEGGKGQINVNTQASVILQQIAVL